jgi:hypothetical protein
VLARLSALSVGFAITSVKVSTPPLLRVEVKVEVISRGANDVTCPRLLVVRIKTVLENVELNSHRIKRHAGEDILTKYAHGMNGSGCRSTSNCGGTAARTRGAS